MFKRLAPAFLLAVMILSACAPAPVLTKSNTGGPPMSGCQVVNLIPTPAPTFTSSLPPVGADDHILGAKDARVTIIEYSDYT
jgi:hypothetical protein